MTKARSNATAPAAKGQIVVGTGTDASGTLSVGNAGETLVADSSASQGLRWQGNYAAGKNKIINGDFFINQRNTTSTTTTGTYLVDRFRTLFTAGSGSVTGSVEQFTPGSAPVAGYEAKQYCRLVTVGQSASTDRAILTYGGIEDVRTFANQTITVSFWAKAASGTPKVAVEMAQSFGTGGSPSSAVLIYGGQVTLSTSWARYSVTIAIPSISGKTIGTDANSSSVGLTFWVSGGSSFDSRTGTLGVQNGTFDFWGVQVEAGNVATAFQTATGTLAGELAACQRYYWRISGGSAYQPYAAGYANGTTTATFVINHPVTMRVSPTSLDANTIFAEQYDGTASSTGTATIANASAYVTRVNLTGLSGMTAGRGLIVYSNNSTAGYFGLSAEL